MYKIIPFSINSLKFSYGGSHECNTGQVLYTLIELKNNIKNTASSNSFQVSEKSNTDSDLQTIITQFLQFKEDEQVLRFLSVNCFFVFITNYCNIIHIEFDSNMHKHIILKYNIYKPNIKITEEYIQSKNSVYAGQPDFTKLCNELKDANKYMELESNHKVDTFTLNPENILRLNKIYSKIQEHETTLNHKIGNIEKQVSSNTNLIEQTVQDTTQTNIEMLNRLDKQINVYEQMLQNNKNETEKALQEQYTMFTSLLQEHNTLHINIINSVFDKLTEQESNYNEELHNIKTKNKQLETTLEIMKEELINTTFNKLKEQENYYMKLLIEEETKYTNLLQKQEEKHTQEVEKINTKNRQLEITLDFMNQEILKINNNLKVLNLEQSLNNIK